MGRDDDHRGGELADAAACYALASSGLNQPRDYKKLWPWEEAWWRPSDTDPVKDLVKAGALVAAEIDRLNRQKAKAPNTKGCDSRPEKS